MVTPSPTTPITRAAVLRAALGLSGVAAATAPFGIGFGAAAIDAGMSAWEAVAMSAAVFSGAAQFAALDAAASGAGLAATAVVAFAVSVRHVAMGAVLASELDRLSPAARGATVFLLTDATFAQARLAAAGRPIDPALLIGGGLAMWLAWIGGTIVGATLGAGAGDLSAFGIDVLMIAFFVSAVVGEARRPRASGPLVWAAGAAVVASAVSPPHWAVVVGGFAGGLVVAATPASERDA